MKSKKKTQFLPLKSLDMVEETCAGGFANSSAFCPQGKEGYLPCLCLLCYLPCHLIDTQALTISAL